MLLGGFSQELHSADYSWGISIKSPRVYFINSGAIPRRQLLKVRYTRQSKVDF
jgi:hypothetical protein